jgi:large subunit ribosomal protein L2
MAIKIYKPTTPARRKTSVISNPLILKRAKLNKKLIIIRKKNSGRNNQGKITVRHQGGGHRRYIRLVDFNRDKFDIPATVKTIEYDPNRGARIALLNYNDGEKRYIIAPVGLKEGDVVVSSQELVEIKDIVNPDEILLTVDAMTGQDARTGSKGNTDIRTTWI